MVGGTDLVAEEDRGAAHALLDDPAALGNTRDQLQHVVPLPVGAGVIQLSFQKPVVGFQLDSGALLCTIAVMIFVC